MKRQDTLLLVMSFQAEDFAYPSFFSLQIVLDCGYLRRPRRPTPVV
jgi:hypothetical protein